MGGGGNLSAPAEEALPSARPEKLCGALQPWQRKAWLAAVLLRALKACGGGEADLPGDMVLLKMCFSLHML